MTCAACGKKQPAVDMWLSRFTGNHFCRDQAGCDRRRKKAAKT